jgi:hypothetical protein
MIRRKNEGRFRLEVEKVESWKRKMNEPMRGIVFTIKCVL